MDVETNLSCSKIIGVQLDGLIQNLWGFNWTLFCNLIFFSFWTDLFQDCLFVIGYLFNFSRKWYQVLHLAPPSGYRQYLSSLRALRLGGTPQSLKTAVYTTGSGGQMLDRSTYVGLTRAAPTKILGGLHNPLRSAWPFNVGWPAVSGQAWLQYAWWQWLRSGGSTKKCTGTGLNTHTNGARGQSYTCISSGCVLHQNV
jgi:hypothetical protein